MPDRDLTDDLADIAIGIAVGDYQVDIRNDLAPSYPIGPERGSGGRAGAESELWVTLDISGAYVGETPNGGSRRLTYSVYSGRDCCL